MTAGAASPPLRNGWRLYAHPMLSAQLLALVTEVERLRAKFPDDFQRKAATRRLAALRKVLLEAVPADPASPAFRQGNTLGGGNGGWFRAKFGQQYRLFYRFDSASKVIVYAWLNDEETLRAYGSRSDAYAVFKSMLDAGNPPSTWAELLAGSAALEAL